MRKNETTGSETALAPSEGEKKMKKPTKSAVILRWNPAFSSFGTADYLSNNSFNRNASEVNAFGVAEKSRPRRIGRIS